MLTSELAELYWGQENPMTFDRLIYIDRLMEAVSTLDHKIDGVRTEFTNEIELTARDLTIRGAGGLVIIATLIIGLKLFG
jgi:hypothetical protein